MASQETTIPDNISSSMNENTSHDGNNITTSDNSSNHIITTTEPTPPPPPPPQPATTEASSHNILRHQETSIPPFDTRPHGKKSGLFGASCNLVNSIVGAGIIGIPYAIKQSGLISGIFLIVLVSYLTDKSLRMLVETAKFNPHLHIYNITTFEDLISFPFGHRGVIFILFNMFIMAYGAMIAYLLIIKDTIPLLFGIIPSNDDGMERELILIVTSLLIILPLSIQRDLASLAVTSFLSIAGDIILGLFILVCAPISQTVSSTPGGLASIITDNAVHYSTLFVGLGIMSTAMACQHSCFIVHNSLSDNHVRRRWIVVSGASLTFSGVVTGVLGVAGYLGFLDRVQGDVFNNFDKGSGVVNAARGVLGGKMFLTYPMESFVGRHVLVALIHGGQDACGAAHEEEHGGCLERGVWNRRERMTLLVYVTTLIPALIFNDLGPVLSITGSLGGSCVAYIGPGMVYLGVNGDAFLRLVYDMLPQQQMTSSDEVAENKSVTSELEQNGCSLELPSNCSTPSLSERQKPLWYYLLGYPIWCAIAQTGSNGMKAAIAEREADNPQSPPDEEMTAVQVDELVHPSKGDFFVAIFYILFGIVAAVAGLVSNIYLIMRDHHSHAAGESVEDAEIM